MSHRRHTFFVPLIAAAALATPSLAFAGPLVADAPSCDTSTAAPVFAPFGDPAQYVLAPGGAAEALKPWIISGKVALTKSEETWKIHSSKDLYSLSIAKGASATTATMCVGITHPDMRFFIKTAKAVVRVDALVEAADGSVQTVPIGTVTGTSSWAPTPQLVIAASLLPLLPDSHTPVRFKFTNVSSTTVSALIDDVYVDPFGRY